jgi:SAM-dependent methyltransferase
MKFDFILNGEPAYLWAQRLLERVTDEVSPPASVIDVGTGPGYSSLVFTSMKYKVTGISLNDGPKLLEKEPLYAHVRSDLIDADIPEADIVWCSHTLEHVTDVGMFLRKCRRLVKPGGWFCITVPADNQDLLIDGHLSFWTPAHLIVNLVHAGFNCKEAKWYTEMRDIGLMVKRNDVPAVDLNYDRGDLEALSPYFPCPLVHRKTSPWLKDNFS